MGHIFPMNWWHFVIKQKIYPALIFFSPVKFDFGVCITQKYMEFSFCSGSHWHQDCWKRLNRLVNIDFFWHCFDVSQQFLDQLLDCSWIKKQKSSIYKTLLLSHSYLRHTLVQTEIRTNQQHIWQEFFQDLIFSDVRSNACFWSTVVGRL